MSSRTLLALLPLVLLVLLLDVWALLDLAKAHAVRHLPKFTWAVIVIASAPFGALAYLTLGRSPHGHDRYPSARADAASKRATGRR